MSQFTCFNVSLSPFNLFFLKYAATPFTPISNWLLLELLLQLPIFVLEPPNLVTNSSWWSRESGTYPDDRSELTKAGRVFAAAVIWGRKTYIALAYSSATCSHGLGAFSSELLDRDFSCPVMMTETATRYSIVLQYPLSEVPQRWR